MFSNCLTDLKVPEGSFRHKGDRNEENTQVSYSLTILTTKRSSEMEERGKEENIFWENILKGIWTSSVWLTMHFANICCTILDILKSYFIIIASHSSLYCIREKIKVVNGVLLIFMLSIILATKIFVNEYMDLLLYVSI